MGGWCGRTFMSEFLGSLIDLLQKAFQAFDEVHPPVLDLARADFAWPDQSTNVLAGPQTTGFYPAIENTQK